MVAQPWQNLQPATILKEQAIRQAWLRCLFENEITACQVAPRCCQPNIQRPAFSSRQPSTKQAEFIVNKANYLISPEIVNSQVKKIRKNAAKNMKYGIAGVSTSTARNIFQLALNDSVNTLIFIVFYFQASCWNGLNGPC